VFVSRGWVLGPSTRMGKSTAAGASSTERPKTVIGWIEYVHLPAVSAGSFEAKIDTGAETCALHATNITVSGQYVSFKTNGKQLRLKLKEIRSVKSSNGSEALRPVIEIELWFNQRREKVEFTLTNRDGMKYPVLLGRNYLKEGYLVDVAHRYILGKPTKQRPRGQVRR
jgi:hypothetical protein